MDTLIPINFVIFIGLDPKKWISRLLGIYGFISGSLIGFVGGDGSPSWLVGGILAALVMYTNATTYWQRQHFRSEAASWLSKYGEEDRQPFSFLASVIKKLICK